jgi:KDO2-lipid IV(A) lauroyltransferase
MTPFLFKSLFRLLSGLPLRWLHGMGALFGRATFGLSDSYAARTEENLRQSGLAAGEAHYAALLRQTIAEAGKGIFELPWIWGRPLQEVCAAVKTCLGWEHIEAARARGNGIIFLTPHWGCFEITSLYVGQHLPVTCLYSTPKRSWLDAVMRSGRERGSVRLATADLSGVRQLFKDLKRGGAIGLLPDQVPSQGDGEWVDFFARPAYTMTLVGRFAQSSGADVLLVYAERLAHGAGYRLNIEPLPLDLSVSVPRQINAALERVIAISPAQYLWSYNRYKVPAGVLPPASGEQSC